MIRSGNSEFALILKCRPMKGNPDSGIQGIFDCEIRNPGLLNLE